MPTDAIAIAGPTAASYAECEGVLRSLPEWFGIESALLQYAADAEKLPTFTARASDRLIGFLTIKHHFPASAEVSVAAVHRDRRGRGVGSALLAAAEEWLRAGGVRLLQVKTLSAAHPDPHYAQTRDFYLRRGFVPLEELPQLWNEANPCLLMVKTLSDPPHGHTER